ncbi:MAG: Rpn family recombination-promoting nuclease/putative transposase [Caldilineaceae bacterium]
MATPSERTLVSFDWAMKNILRDKANFDVLEGFLSTLLNEDIRILSLLEGEANQQYDLDKYNRVDLLAIDANAQALIIELQYTWQPAYLKRLLYGTSKLIVEQIKIGESFDQVRKVISISILYFPVSQMDDDYLYHGKTEFIGMNNGKALCVDMAKLPKPDKANQQALHKHGEGKTVNIFPEYYLIEVEHFQNIIRQPIDEWVYLFKNSQVPEDFHSKNIQAAKEKLMVLHMSEAERKAYEQFQTSRASAMDLLAGQYQEGMAQGIEIGKEETKRENARRMKAKGLDLTLIADISGLSETEIQIL